jgi:hypothetical protein
LLKTNISFGSKIPGPLSGPDGIGEVEPVRLGNQHQIDDLIDAVGEMRRLVTGIFVTLGRGEKRIVVTEVVEERKAS